MRTNHPHFNKKRQQLKYKTMYTIIKASDIDTSQNAWELMEFSNSVEDILECFILYEYPNTSTLFLSLGSK